MDQRVYLRRLLYGIRMSAIVLLLGMCKPPGSTGSDNHTGNTPIPAQPGLLQVNQVEVLVAESMPPQVSVRVQGVLEDGCARLGTINQQRTGATITVTITTQRSGATVCALVAQHVDQTTRLEGVFSPGEYIVRVNGVERTFRI